MNSFKSGDASALASNFDSYVEITIKSSGNSYSKNQAEMVMRDFFNTNSPKSFALVHQGTSPEGAKYFIANMSASTGIYRTYVYAKTMAGKLAIQEIRIDQ
ncbi:MAG: DUF4783 domain-containing protein [Bacteroidetes bacterium]|nr:DUF4783 domain-containing protein [Bacteroidota bacterium]